MQQMKARNDLLARVACRALTELEDNGIADMLLLRDDETREFWIKHKEFDRKRRAAEEKKLRLEELKKAALAKLSNDEREALGIKAAPRTRKKISPATALPVKATKAAIIKDMQEIMNKAYENAEFDERDK
jgi:hypothetical protein